MAPPLRRHAPQTADAADETPGGPEATRDMDVVPEVGARPAAASDDDDDEAVTARPRHTWQTNGTAPAATPGETP
jgi:hypothetical protein